MDFAKEIDDPVSRFALAVFQVNGLLMRNGERITRSLGQSSAKWQVLGRAGYAPQSVARMARDMGLARQSVQRVADVLARDGLVVFRDDPDDRRTFLVEISEKGRLVLGKIYAKNREWSQIILQRLGPELLTEAASGLEYLAGVFEEVEKGG